MKNVSIARWKGRIEAAFTKLLVTNGLQFNMPEIPDDKWPAVFFALSQRVHTQRQKEWCQRLLAKSAIVYYQTEDPIHKEVLVNDPQEKSLGSREVEYWYEKDRSGWGDKIIADADYLPEIEEDDRKQAKRNKIALITLLSIVAVIIASFVIYNLPYFAEKRAFAVVENNPCLFEIDRYLDNYPNGAHKEEALQYREAELRRIEDEAFQEVTECWEEHDILSTLNKIPTYLNSYPEGRYVDSVNALYNIVWDSIIAKYDQSVDYKLSKPGHAYVHDMLVYMKEHNVRTVTVAGHPKIDLKEFDEYPAGIQELTILITDDTKDRFRFPRDLQPIKDKISVTKAESWTKDISVELRKKFDNLFGYGLIHFVTEDKSDSTVCHPTIDVTYVIKNQESLGMPDVWTYTQKQGPVVVDGAFYLGIALDFTAEFSIPDRKDSFKVKVIGDPGSMSFIGVEPSQIYNKMCERCLNEFGQKIETSLGLAAKE